MIIVILMIRCFKNCGVIEMVVVCVIKIRKIYDFVENLLYMIINYLNVKNN